MAETINTIYHSTTKITLYQMMSFSKKDIIHILCLFALLLLPNVCALFMAVDMEGSWVMKAGYMGMVAVCLFLPALLFKTRTYFFIEGVFSFLFMPIDIASLYLNKQSASKLFLNSILNTDILEATELLQTLWPICLIVFLLWGIYIYLCVRIPNLPFVSKKLRLWGVVASFAMILATYVSLTLLIRKINPNDSTREVMVESLDKFGMKFQKIYPYNLYINACLLWQDQREWNQAQANVEAFSFGISTRDAIDSTLFILYIGEAARYDHMGINGYERNTTPCLSAQNNLISFSSIYAQANLTNYSIPFLLTRATAADREVMHHEKSILEAFQEAGYQTAFLSKNSYSPFTMRIMNSCDYHHIFSRGLDAVDSYDIDLVQHLQQIANHKGQFAVLHSLGSHFKYSLRYPEEATYFTPALKPNDGYKMITEEHKEVLINAYDNSIRYADYVVSELIQWADSLDQKVVIMYISDHGESFWDDERKLSLHGSYELCEAEYHVPCFIWYSDEYQQAFPHKVDLLLQNKDVPHNSSITFSTLLDLADITEVVDSTRSLCSPYIQPQSSFPVLNGAGELKTYVIQ